MPLKPVTNSTVGNGRQLHWVYTPATPSDVELHYLLYLPKGGDANGGGRWPLVLFLHGAGERGQDLAVAGADARGLAPGVDAVSGPA